MSGICRWAQAVRLLGLALLTVVGILLTPATVWAGPVLPEPVAIIQPDGSVIQAVPFGDEWDNGYETLDGFTIVRDDASGFWFYAIGDGEGRLISSGLLPGRDAPDGVTPHLRSTNVFAPNRFSISAQRADGLMGATGNQAVLVLLTSFSNQGPVGSTPAQWSSLFFAPTGSIKHYYQEVSYGQLTLLPAAESQGTVNDGVIGWLNLGYPHPNTGGSTGDANRRIVRDALLAADPFINFATYDTNHDGYIAAHELHLVVIVAGYEASYGGAALSCTPSVWAHHWSLSGAVPAPMLDGVLVGSYAGGYSQVGEWHCRFGDNPGHMGTMGQTVHELGHDIGWPDLYDVDGSSYGVGYYSIMANGSWRRTAGYAGSLPSHPDAFLKWYQGWLTPEQIVGTRTDVQLRQVETNPLASVNTFSWRIANRWATTPVCPAAVS